MNSHRYLSSLSNFRSFFLSFLFLSIYYNYITSRYLQHIHNHNHRHNHNHSNKSLYLHQQQQHNPSITPVRGDISWVTCRRNASCCSALYSYESEPHKLVEIEIGPEMESKLRIAAHNYYNPLNNIKYSIAVRQSSDVVSNEIAANRSWEPISSRAMLDALRQPRYTRHTRHTRHTSTTSSTDSLLLDIGANIGWFTMLAAHTGYNVVAFEPFEENRHVLFHSLCLAPKSVQERVQVFPVALGSSDTDGMTCDMWRGGGNRGNVMTTCRKGGEDTMRDRHGWKLDGSIQPKSLDSLHHFNIPHNVNNVVVKIDVEGWEPMALEGAKHKLFGARKNGNGNTNRNTNHMPNTIIAEIIPGTIKRAAKSIGMSNERADELAVEFVQNLTQNGYNYTMVHEDRNFIFHRKSQT